MLAATESALQSGDALLGAGITQARGKDLAQAARVWLGYLSKELTLAVSASQHCVRAQRAPAQTAGLVDASEMLEHAK
eukprot:1187209-Alexandrium_andersonii.AAC.1